MALVFNPLARETAINFLRTRHVTLALSALLVVLSLGLLVRPGLNFGVDFLGGTQVTLPVETGVSLIEMQSQIRAAHPFLSTIEVQAFGESARFIMPLPDAEEVAAQGVNEEAFLSLRLVDALAAVGLAEGDPRVSDESIGGQFSGELRSNAILAVVIALLAIAVYIAVRFEWRFSIAALVALIHDAITTLGLFALLQLEVNLEVVAAVLTIAGYSINDTVVVFDRIREEMRRAPDEPLLSLLNRSLNKTLSRTLMTSVTTLLALIMLFWLAGAEIGAFSIALIWGVLIGTYSSLFLATPLLYLMGLSSKVFERQDVDPDQMEDSALAWASKLEDTSVETLEGETVTAGSTPKRTKGKPRKNRKKS